MSARRRAAGRPPREAPYKRNYDDGRVVWIARFRDLEGRRQLAKPRWNGGRSTLERKGDAQAAIDEALERLHTSGVATPQQIGAYFANWLTHHPRSERTNKTQRDRVGYVLDVDIEGRPLRDWRFDELRRRQVLALVDYMLRIEGRAAQGILSALSAMAEDAIGDDVAQVNAFSGLHLRRSGSADQKASAQAADLELRADA